MSRYTVVAAPQLARIVLSPLEKNWNLSINAETRPDDPLAATWLGGFHLRRRPAMLIQLTVFVPAVIAIYAATGAWVFSCDPISKTVDIRD